jgi:hypothetical protein
MVLHTDTNHVLQTIPAIVCQTLRSQNRAHSLRVYLQRLRALALRPPAFKILFWLCRPVKRGLHGRNFGSLIPVLSILYYPDSNNAARMFALQFPISKSTCHVKCKNTHLSDRHLTSTNHCSGSLCYTMYIFTDPSDKSPHTAFACNTQATAYSFYLATAFANETQISGWFSMLPLLHASTYSISLP